MGFAPRRGMKKAFAALGGAVAAVLIVLVGVGTLYHPPTHDNWDLGTPMLTLAALLPAALFGAMIGFLLVDLVQARQRKAAGWVGGGGVLLIVMIPVGIVFLPYFLRFFPSRPPSPSEMRAEWARRLGQAPADLGARLAEDLRRCIGDQAVPPSGEALLAMGCDAAPRRSLALGPEKLHGAGKLFRQRRRLALAVHGQRRPAPADGASRSAPGPARPHVRDSAARDACGTMPPPRPKPRRFNRDSTLLRLAHFRECVRARAAGFRQAGTWSGLGESLPAAARNPGAGAAGCPAVGIYDAAEGPLRPWFLQVRDGGAYPLRVEYRAVFDGSVDTPFELSVVTAGTGQLVGYMIDRHGEWHVRAGERPFADDPAPDPCMLDLSVPCQ